MQAIKNKPKKIFIGGIPLNCSLEEIQRYLQKFGSLISCRLARTKKGILKGFGFAEFETLEQSLRAVGKNHVIKGKKFEIKIQTDSIKNKLKKKADQKRKVFVRKLGKNINERDLEKYFARFGDITSVSLLRNYKTQLSRRVGHILFVSETSAASVIQIKEHIIKGKRIECEVCHLVEEIHLKKGKQDQSNSTHSTKRNKVLTNNLARIEQSPLNSTNSFSIHSFGQSNDYRFGNQALVRTECPDKQVPPNNTVFLFQSEVFRDLNSKKQYLKNIKKFKGKCSKNRKIKRKKPVFDLKQLKDTLFSKNKQNNDNSTHNIPSDKYDKKQGELLLGSPQNSFGTPKYPITQPPQYIPNTLLTKPISTCNFTEKLNSKENKNIQEMEDIGINYILQSLKYEDSSNSRSNCQGVEDSFQTITNGGPEVKIDSIFVRSQQNDSLKPSINSLSSLGLGTIHLLHSKKREEDVAEGKQGNYFDINPETSDACTPS